MKNNRFSAIIKIFLMILMLPFGFFAADFSLNFVMVKTNPEIALLFFFGVIVLVPTLIVRPWKEKKKSTS